MSDTRWKQFPFPLCMTALLFSAHRTDCMWHTIRLSWCIWVKNNWKTFNLFWKMPIPAHPLFSNFSAGMLPNLNSLIINGFRMSFSSQIKAVFTCDVMLKYLISGEISFTSVSTVLIWSGKKMMLILFEDWAVTTCRWRNSRSSIWVRLVQLGVFFREMMPSFYSDPMWWTV